MQRLDRQFLGIGGSQNQLFINSESAEQGKLLERMTVWPLNGAAPQAIGL
jgi:hypothetical protein